MILKAIQRRGQPIPQSAGFPYAVPLIHALDRFEFSAPVTFLVGENGSGKSTFLELLACAAGSITVGSESVLTDKTLLDIRTLAKGYQLIWTKRTKRGFFMRAEDFFGYAKAMAQTRAEMHSELERVDQEYEGRSEQAKGLAKLPFANEINAMQKAHGEGLNTRSHGEAFLDLFRSRFQGEGLYLLDEPEAPLSPMRQLSFLVLLHEMVEKGGQFVIATHSPIIMAYPGATILSCDEGRIQQVDYDQLDHVVVMRDFLNNPQQYLRHLLG